MYCCHTVALPCSSLRLIASHPLSYSMEAAKAESLQQNLSTAPSLQADIDFILRFKDTALEDRFILHMQERDRPLSRWIAILALLATLALHLVDFFTLPLDAAFSSLILRMPLFLVGWGLFLYSTNRLTPTPTANSWLVFFSAFACIAAITLGQWSAWKYGGDGRYQSTLIIPLFAPMLGCMPWRLSGLLSIASAVLIALPEYFHQPDAYLLNLHLSFIGMASLAGVFGGYVLEHHSRQHFLINENFLQQSRHDPLTGLPNRRELDAALLRLLQQSAREGKSVAVAMFDVDHFKAYNDHYGHTAGDSVLIAVAHAARHNATPPPSFVARYGGEEFVAVWVSPNVDMATLGEGLRRAISGTTITHSYSPHRHITASIGLTSLHPTAATASEAVLAAADRALYRAKERGRNRVETETVIDHTDTIAIKRPTSAATDDSIDTRSTPEDRRRWGHERGLYERHQIIGTGLLCILINGLSALMSYKSLAPQASGMLVFLVLTIVLPSLAIGCWLCRFDRILLISRYLMPVFIFVPGLCYCYAFHYALSRGWYVPYEVVLISIFQIFIVGGQSWIGATFAGWTLSLLNIGIQIYYNPHDPATTAVIPFLALCAAGTLVSRTQDLRSMDSFIKKGKLETLARHDALTGLANRKGMEDHFTALLPALARPGHTLAVGMIDIDHFKAYNDHYGHAAGDAVLTAVAHALRQQVPRPQDLAVRYGGEEFILIWYQARTKDLVQLGERACAAVRERDIPHLHGRNQRITISIGIAQNAIPLHNRQDIDALIQRADRALYRAKAAGRDRVVLANQQD